MAKIAKQVKVEIAKLIEDVNAIAVKHDTYTEQYVKGGNAVKYKLLAEIMNVCECVLARADCAVIIENLRTHMRKEFGIKTQKNSTVVAIIVRMIVRANRKTTFVYKSVIDAAMAKGVTSAGLVKFLQDGGGIEKVRKQDTKVKSVKAVLASDANAKVFAAYKQDLHKAKSLGSIKVKGDYLYHLAARDVKFTYVMCKHNVQTGEMDAIGVIYPNAMVELYALEQQLGCIKAASFANDLEAHEYLKQNKYNTNYFNAWKQANGIETAAQANAIFGKYKKLYQELMVTAQSANESNISATPKQA